MDTRFEALKWSRNMTSEDRISVFRKWQISLPITDRRKEWPMIAIGSSSIAIEQIYVWAHQVVNDKTIEVTGCIDCPFCNFFDTIPGYYCNAEDRDLDGDDHITPDWCPLKKNSVTIKIKEQ